MKNVTFPILTGILVIFTVWIIFSTDEDFTNHAQTYTANENLWVIEKLKNNEDVNLSGLDWSGLDLSGLDLSDKAFLIPKIKLEKTKSIIGKNTISAIRAGFYHGYSGLIDNIIKMIIKQTGKSFNIILTGGYSYLFKNSIKRKTIIKKDLTINGVLKAAVFSK